MMILAGHGCQTAALELGIAKVSVIGLHPLRESDKCAYVLADNRIAEIADWDMELVAARLT